MLRGFSPLDNYLLYWVSVHCKLWGVDTLKNEGRCSATQRDGERHFGVDTLKNEGRCSSEWIITTLSSDVDTLGNEGRCNPR